MPDSRPSITNAAAQAKHRRGLKSALAEIQTELRELPDQIKAIIATALAEQQQREQQHKESRQ